MTHLQVKFGWLILALIFVTLLVNANQEAAYAECTKQFSESTCFKQLR